MKNYKYLMRLRPPAIGTHPVQGLVEILPADKKTVVGNYAILVYDRELSRDEWYGHDLYPAWLSAVGYRTLYTEEHHGVKMDKYTLLDFQDSYERCVKHYDKVDKVEKNSDGAVIQFRVDGDKLVKFEAVES